MIARQMGASPWCRWLLGGVACLVAATAHAATACAQSGQIPTQQLAFAGPLADQTPRFLSEPMHGGAARVDMSSALVLRHRITINLTKVPLGDALAAVAAQGHFELTYSPDLVALDRPVSLHAEEITIAAALTELLFDSAIDVQVSPTGHATLIPRFTGEVTTPKAKTVAAKQGRVITGRVFDNNSKQGLPSVQVLIKGTLIGRPTKDDGTYSLPVPSGPLTLVFRRIGYIAIERPVTADETTVDVGLLPDVLKLEQTVVTGQATGVSKKNLANDVSVVNADELNEVQTQTLEQSLQGKVAGADIQSNSGAPGGGMQVRLRGVSSIIGSSDPLYVVDGVIISNAAIAPGTNAITKASGTTIGSNEDNATNRLADLDPNDIENIEVLKGASAAAIYGSKAANGVVLITTKRGHAGKPKIDVGQRFGFNSLSRQLGSRTFTDSADAVGAFGPSAAPYFANGMVPRTYNHDAELAGNTPLNFQTTGSVSGGSDATQYYVSGINEHDGGIIQNTYFNKTSATVHLNQAIGARTQLDFGQTFSHTSAGRGLTNNDNVGASFYAAMPSIPNFVNLQQLPDGSFPNNPFGTSNPLQTAALLHNDEGVYRSITSARASLQLLSSEHQTLSFIADGGADYFSQSNSVYSPPELQYEQAYGTFGEATLTNTNNLFTNLNLNLVHVYTPASAAFKATSSIGVQQETRAQTLASTYAKDLSGNLTNIDKGTSAQVYEQRQTTNDQGLFAQEEFLTLDERLLLTAGVRGDRSSNNADTKTLYFYPKFSASFRVPTKTSVLDEVKFRAAVGESGNEPLYGQKFGEFISNTYNGLASQQVLGTVAAPDLRPERELEVEGGADLTFLHGMATLSITGYQKRITDLLLQRSLVPSMGDTTEFLNGGVLRTRGIEVATTVQAVQRKNFQWQITANFAKDASIIEELPVAPFSPGGFPTSFGAFEIQAGASPTQIIGNVTKPDGSVVVQKIGDVNPDYRVGLGNTLSYKSVHLYFLFSAQKGGDDINLTELLYDLAQNSPDYAQKIHVGDSTVMKGAYRVSQWPGNTAIYVQDASFIKLREVTLSYDIPTRYLGVIGRAFDNASVSVSGRNLLTITHYQGMDPEVSNFGNQNIARNVDVAPFPPSRTFWFGINLGF
jgi:TonB-linked SusC/RagA family outer membrane protein